MKKFIVLLIILIIAGCSTKSEKEAGSLPDFDALWDYNNPQQTEVKFRELLPRAKESNDTSYYAQLLTQIARTQGLQRKFDEAHSTLDSVEAMLADKLTVAKIRYLLERGRVYNSSNQREKSIQLFNEAWDLGIKNNEDFYAVDAAHMLAIVEPSEAQLEWSEKAIKLAEKSKDPRARNWLGSLYNNTGWTYHDLKQYDKALGMFQKALSWQEKKGNEENIRIAKWTIARTYRSLGKIEEALQIQRELEKEFKEKGIEQDGYVFEEIGECLFLLDRKDEAKKYFQQAYELLSKDEWLLANQPERLKRLNELSR
jgi:tetratricopeptide (TPR) repeat protein